MTGPPWWQRQIIGVEQFVTTQVLIELVVGGVSRQGASLSRRLLRVGNLPSATDVDRLLTQIASVEREVRELRASSARPSDPEAMKP